MQKLNLTICPNINKALQMQNKIRLQNSHLKVTGKYRNQRQKLRSLRKNKGKVDQSYMAGSYSKSIVPDSIIFDIIPLGITFVADEDVPSSIENYKQ